MISAVLTVCVVKDFYCLIRSFNMVPRETTSISNIRVFHVEHSMNPLLAPALRGAMLYNRALIAQWIERIRPKDTMEVRFLLGAPQNLTQLRVRFCVISDPRNQ